MKLENNTFTPTINLEALLAENQRLKRSNSELNTLNNSLNQRLSLAQNKVEKLVSETILLKHNQANANELNFEAISVEKQIAKNELLDSEKRLQLALDAGQLGIWDWDIATNEVIYNKRWAAMLGYGVEELPANVDTFFSLLHEEDLPIMNGLVSEHLKGERPFFEVEIRLKGKDGKYHWIYDRGMVVSRDENGNPLRALGIHVYINDYKVATQALKDSEKRFRNIFYFNSIGIIISNVKGEILDANPKMIDILGYSLDELRSMRPIDFSHPDDIEEERRQAKEMFAHGRDCFKMEKRYICKGGCTIWTNFSLTIIRDEDQNMQMAIALLEDITEKKEAEEKLKEQNQMLLKMNEELNHFVYRTSHDLRAPITSLMGLVNITEMADNEAERARYLSMMNKQLHYLDGVIKEIIDYRKVSAGEVRINQISLSEKVADVMQHFQFLPNYDKMEKKIEITGDAPFYSDETKLNIILNNLISNAIKYSDSNKEKPYLHINIQISLQEVVFDIKDNGIGIESVHLPKIFNMFFRATSKQNGTGLGLYIVSEALNKLGAKISVSSELHKGTHFSLIIPNML